MPRLASRTQETGKTPRRGPRARRVLDRAPRFRSWHTTDEEEIERRRQRGTSEPLTVKPLEAQYPVFGTFRVSSEGGGAYKVEIRSLSQRNNSCGCPDYQVNGLGTCKHIEAVLARLAKKRSLRAGSERIEIFLRTTGEAPEVRIQFPAGSGRSTAGRLLAPFFSDDGGLLGDPVTALPALARTLAGTQRRVKEGVRLSHHLLPWVDEQRRRAARRTAREQLLADVEAGRQSLDLVKHSLFPYQQEGMLHLAFTERALLADEMGLGKTVQAIAACELLRRLRGVERVLVVSPASLKAEWEEQIARFTDLPVRVLQGTRAQRLRQYGPGAFFYLANYEQVLTDGDDLQRRLAPDVIILDEAQRIKNWQSKTAAAVKRLKSPYAFVLTGTPLENRIDEIYSIVQFLDPSLLGPLFRFNRDFYKLDDRGRPAGYRNLGELHRRLSAVLLRRRKSEVEGQLPARSDKHYFVPLEEEQFARYSEYKERVAKLSIERLAAAGFLQITSEGRRLLDRFGALAPGADAERSRRLAEAREIFSQAERKIRMATMLAGGGFPVEALPALREGVESALRASVYLQGPPLPEHEEVPLGWVRDHLPAHLPLVSALRSGPEALLAVGEASARQWVREGEELAERVRGELPN